MTLKAILAIVTPLLLVALKDVLHRILMAIVGRKVVEWLVMNALDWLAKHSKSRVDDELVEIVRQELKAPAGSDSDKASPAGVEASPEASEAAICPTCGKQL
jgi:hypothetical protein